MSRALRNTVFLCTAPSGGACPKCGKDTEKDYTGARICYDLDGGCGWSDYEPWMPLILPCGLVPVDVDAAREHIPACGICSGHPLEDLVPVDHESGGSR